MLVLSLVFFFPGCHLSGCGQGFGINVRAACISLGPMASSWPPFVEATDSKSLLFLLPSLPTLLTPSYHSQEMEITGCPWDLQDPKKLSPEPYVFRCFVPHSVTASLLPTHTCINYCANPRKVCIFPLATGIDISSLPENLPVSKPQSSQIAFFQLYH